MENSEALVIVHDDIGFRQLEVDGGVLRYTNGKHQSVIPIGSVRSFAIKDVRGPMRPGIITIDIGSSGGSFVRAGGFFASVGSEIQMPFDKPDSNTAYKMQEYIANYNHAQAQQPISAADEIRKFKALCDEGIITPEEFEVKKRELLKG